jgi:hypothetical protein
MWGKEEVHVVFWWEKSDGNKLHGRHRHGWEDNIRMDLQEIGSMLWT